MNFKKAFLLAVSLLFSVSFSFAQKQSLPGIVNLRASAISPIYEKSEVKGYLLYYKGDKADRKNDNYFIDFFDQDLNKVKSITMQKPRKSYFLLRNAYNGSVFSFYFYNYRKGTLELETYDRGLNKLATHLISEMSTMDKAIINQELEKGTTSDNSIFGGMNLFPVPEKGFVRNSYEGMGKRYMLEMFDNNLKLKWRYIPERGKDYESVGVTEVTDKYVMATIARRPGMLSKKIDVYVAAFDIETGKKVLDMPIETGQSEQLSLSTVSYDEQKQEFLVLGEYYNADDKPFVSKSQGFFIKRFGLDGKENSAKLYGWNKEVNALLPAAARESIENNYINYIHKIIKDASGNMYLVAEQYKITVSAGGIAVQALGGNASSAKGKIGNLLIFSIDPSDVLKDVKFYGKEEMDCMLPPGSGWYGAGLLGHVIKMESGFGYQFNQSDNEASDFSFAYLDFHKKGDKTTLVNVLLDNKGAFSTDKIDVSSGKRSRSYTYPGKVGYNMIVDYDEKIKQMEMRLVKLNKQD